MKNKGNFLMAAILLCFCALYGYGFYKAHTLHLQYKNIPGVTETFLLEELGFYDTDTSF